MDAAARRLTARQKKKLPCALAFDPPPAEGAGHELEAHGLMKTSQNKEAAKQFLDWTLSDRAVDAYYDWKEIVTTEGGSMPQSFLDAGLPADHGSVMYEMDYSGLRSSASACSSSCAAW